MSRIIALDVGSKRIGVATSDATRIIATAQGFIARSKFETEIQELTALLEKYQSNTIVVGLPLNMNGTDSQQTGLVREYKAKLEAALPDVDFQFWDERLSTSAGEKFLISSNVSRKKRKTKIDAVAAQWILQGYLESLRKA